MIENHVVMYSSGKASFVAAYLVAKKYGTENLTLLFADTKIEDESNYKFLEEGAKYLGAKLEVVADGRTPWEVFEDTKWINHRSANCSKYLKQIPCREWLENKKELTPENTTLYVGIDFNEYERMTGILKGWHPWKVEAPLCWGDEWIDREQVNQIIVQAGLTPSKLYGQGFSHANCGGFCIRAGKAHFRNLLEVNPDLYKYHEQKEQQFRKAIDNYEVGILRQTRNGITKGLTLKDFRETLESEPKQLDLLDWGGCGCFS